MTVHVDGEFCAGPNCDHEGQTSLTEPTLEDDVFLALSNYIAEHGFIDLSSMDVMFPTGNLEDVSKAIAQSLAEAGRG